MGCKNLISWKWCYRGGVSQLNGGGYSLRGSQKHHIHTPKSVYSISQNCRTRSCTVAEQHHFG